MNKLLSIELCVCGFHLNYENGYAISIQFGSGTYSDNNLKMYGKEEETKTVEVAIVNPNGDLINLNELPNSPIYKYTIDTIAAYVPIGEAFQFANEYTYRKALYEIGGKT